MNPTSTSASSFPVVQYTKKFDEALDPQLFTRDSVGYDLFTPIDMEIPPGKRVMIDTGIILYMNPYPDTDGNHFYAQLMSKSSVSTQKHCIVDGGGVIDPGYRGSIRVVSRNVSLDEKTIFKRGDPIAQMIFQRVLIPQLLPLDSLKTVSTTERGTRGFGGMLM